MSHVQITTQYQSYNLAKIVDGSLSVYHK